MTNTERVALLRVRLSKIEQKNTSCGLARKLRRQIRNLSK